MKTDYTRYRLSLMENIVFGMGYLVAAAVVCIIFYDSFLPLILMLPTGVYVRRLFEEYKKGRGGSRNYIFSLRIWCRHLPPVSASDIHLRMLL